MLLFLLACFQKEPEIGICGDICKEVYSTCLFEAYPSYESCLEGCTYNEEEGGDLEGQLECIQEAECDTFAIIECENQYGATSDD